MSRRAGPGVAAAGRTVAPAGCTAHLIFASGGNQHVGTARHYVNSSDLAGTRITKMMNQWGVSLVNANGTTTAPGASTNC